MAKRKKNDEERKPDGPVDPYTGEVERPAEDAYKVNEVIPTDPDNREGENYLLEEEDSLDKYILDSNADAIAEETDEFTEDKEVSDHFADRQDLASGGRRKLQEKLNQHNFQDPDLSGGDIDAAWEDSVVAGEESVGGTAPTPDQDVVDELGEGVGLTYEDDEPLDSDKKLLDRDRNRWELDPESAEERDEEDGE